jgi:hypothetical protein
MKEAPVEITAYLDQSQP